MTEPIEELKPLMTTIKILCKYMKKHDIKDINGYTPLMYLLKDEECAPKYDIVKSGWDEICKYCGKMQSLTICAKRLLKSDSENAKIIASNMLVHAYCCIFGIIPSQFSSTENIESVELDKFVVTACETSRITNILLALDLYKCGLPNVVPTCLDWNKMPINRFSVSMDEVPLARHLRVKQIYATILSTKKTLHFLAPFDRGYEVDSVDKILQMLMNSELLKTEINSLGRSSEEKLRILAIPMDQGEPLEDLKMVKGCGDNEIPLIRAIMMWNPGKWSILFKLQWAFFESIP